MKPCAGVGGAPCPHKKAVVRGDRCPDCKLAETRRRQRPGLDRDELLKRIATSAPPASTVDGQLRRWKDRQEAIAGGADVDDIDDDTEPDLDAELDDAPPPPRLRAKRIKPGTRQPAAAAGTVTGELPWWARTKPGEMTKAAEQERERMQGSKEAKKIDGGKIISV